jgi:ABC-type phosphate transport system substrate-binding protein
MNELNSVLLGAASAIVLCVGGAEAATTTINGGGGTATQPVYVGEETLYEAGAPQFAFTYIGTLSSVAQTAFLTNNATLLGEVAGTDVHYAASDRGLSSTQLSGYTLAATDGPLIQVPMVGVPVGVPFRNSALKYGKQLTLTDNQLCGIFSGKLTDWSDVSTAASPGDSASTSFLFTQHLAAVCNSSNSNFTGTLAATSTFATLFAGSQVPPSLTGITTTSGMQKAVLAAPSSIGYITVDYTSLAPKSPNTSSLIVASLVNDTTGVATQPTLGNIVLALRNPGPTATNQVPPSTKAAAANPLNWVPTVPNPIAGYPIVGYGSYDISTCYADPNVTAGLLGFLTAHFSNNAAYNTIIENAGDVTVANSGAATFITAIRNDFLTNRSKYNLNIGNATVCAGVVGR